MARAYGSRIIALTLGVPAKWLDNLLSHFAVTGVPRSRQGVAREISHHGLVRLEIIRSLNEELGLPLAIAVRIAENSDLDTHAEELTQRLPSGYAVTIPIASIERRLRERMLEAVDSVAHIRRGRPKSA